MNRVQMIPSPASISDNGGSIKVTSANSIVFKKYAKDDAVLLQQMIVKLGGPKIPVTSYRADAGDIQVAYNANYTDESYTIDVDDCVKVTGKPKTGLSWGIVSLLQMMEITPDAVSIPRVNIKDKPDSPFRSVMVDLARKWHPMPSLYSIVLMCWWYKIKYLHLHLTDDQSWTLPNKRYPKLPTPERHYSETELKKLNSFAQQHGVTIVPEVDMPGHSLALVKALPKIVGNESAGAAKTTKGDGVIHPGMTGEEAASAICPGRESTYEFMRDIVEQLCRLFPDSPYIHIGADEVNKVPWTTCIHCAKYMQKHGLDDVEELYRHFIVMMNDVVRECGKQTIVWEGFKVKGKVEIPRNIIVMEFENHYELPTPLLKAGYCLINTSWQPLYIVPTVSWPADHILKWNIWRWEHWWNQSQAFPNGINVHKTSQVLGAGMCAWEMDPEPEIVAFLPRVPALSERTWNTKAEVNYDSWLASWNNINARLGQLIASQLK
ncbi:MAG: family 20 glycosylhydrolase [Armatimonadota bacterium]